jgi:hypothetical protein
LLPSDGIIIEGLQEPFESKDDIHMRGTTVKGEEQRLNYPDRGEPAA